MLEILTAVSQGGAAVVVLAVVMLFLKEMRAMRSEFLKTIENHLDHHRESLDKNTKVLDKMHTWVKIKLGSD